ncbi:MAG: methionyl-tRNA formyltransferase [Candidatus Saccharimonadales bacterium]
MKKMSKTIVFFGSGPVAAKSLELLAEKFVIEAVVTKPRAAHHRGSVPVLELAERLGLKTFLTASKQELTELFKSKPVTSEVGVVIDYGIIIDQEVIDYFPYGSVNSHFSLLPEWRGADPITFSVLCGQAQTGVSLMIIVQKMDEGPLLAQGVYDMAKDITTPKLTEDLILLSDSLLETILPMYLEGSVTPAPQDQVSLNGHKRVSYSRKLNKDDGILDFKKSAVQLEREIRAFIEWPKSRTTIGEKEVVITAAHVLDRVNKPGVAVVEAKQLMIGTTDGSLVIDKLKPAGKAEMSAEGFLAGYKL